MIPNNVIIFKQSNNDFVDKKTNVFYKGPYYEYNNRTYAGSAYDPYAPELIKVGSDEYNTLLNNQSTATYSNLKGVTSNQLSDPAINKLPFSSPPHELDPSAVYFFCCKKNETPPVIKRIDEQTYISLSKNPLYKTTYVGIYKNKNQTVEEADRQIPGVASLLIDTNINTSSQTPLQQLAAQPTSTRPVRKTTKIDGKVGQVTSKFKFPPAFLVFVNTGDVTNLGLEYIVGLHVEFCQLEQGQQFAL